MENATAARGLAPAAVRRILVIVNRLAVPACLPFVLALLLLGVAAVAFGWWQSLAAILPGDEFYALQRVAELTTHTLTGSQQAPDAPAPGALIHTGVGVAVAGIIVLVLGGLIRVLKAFIHVRLMSSARDLRLVLADDDVGIGIAALSSQSTTVSLLQPEMPLRSGPGLSVSLSSDFFARTLPRCAGHVRELLALSRDTDRNLELARGLMTCRRRVAPIVPLHRVRVRIDGRSQRLSVGREGLAEFAEKGTDVGLSSLPEARCRQLLRKQPPNKVRTIDLEGRPALVIVGLRETGIELLARACAQAQSPCLDPLVIVLVDAEALAVVRDLRLAYPALSVAVDLVAVALEASLPQSAATLLSKLGAEGLTPTFILIALEEPSLTDAWDRELALAGRTFGYPSPLVLPVLYPRRRHSDRSLLIDEEELDALPRQRHAAYLERWRQSGEPASGATVDWPALPFDYQEDNRFAADHLWTKARDLDLWIAPGIQGLASLPPSSDVEALAMAEHRRWVASRAIAGWRFGAPRSEVLRIHPSLVDWLDLDEAERDKDRSTVIELSQMFAASGLRLRQLDGFALPQNTCRDGNLADILSLVGRAGRRATEGLVLHLVIAIDSVERFRLAQEIAARTDMALSLVLAQPLSGLAIAAGQVPGAAATLMESAWKIWLTRPDAVERVLARWPSLPEDS